MANLIGQSFGRTKEGREVEAWTLCAGEYSAQVLTYGGILRSFCVPAPEGSRDIVLGCETLEDYENQDKYFGALVGRVANRIGGAAFDLNGVHYPLAVNNGPNCLHGGLRGFDRAIWAAREENGALVLTRNSPDGEEGFPGSLAVQVTYSLSEDGTLTLEYQARSDQDTLCNLTNHSYFNLLGHAHGSLGEQKIQILADAITEMDENSTPTGMVLPVDGTPFDLREPVEIRVGLAMEHPQLKLGNGYDHNFVLHRQSRGPLKQAARVTGGGLCLECRTTQPGMQFYTANFLEGEAGKGGACYGPRSAFCLETQAWPDAIHHENFPCVVLGKGESYHHVTTYQVTKNG
ncbi:aldose epimerase family protein [Lawsonibacter sp. LCP25S3_G6]|uniref:aldose epimerase family protein n=1 Tax=unclassified Lawsonibacter TaxID=2617946 RepID=UPI003F961FD8